MLFDLLLSAIRRGDAERLVGLLDLEERDDDGRTALMMAAQMNQLPVVRLLLDHGARMDAVDKQRYTSLSYAVCEGRKSIVDLLVEKGASVLKVHQSSFPY